MTKLGTHLNKPQKRSVFGLFVFAIVVAILTGVAYTAYSEYKDGANNVLAQSQTLAVTLGKNDELTRFGDNAEEVNSVSYKYLSSLLGQFNQIPVGVINSVFILGQRDDGSVFFYVGSDGGNVAPGTTYQEASTGLKRVFSTGISESFIETNSWGSWLTGATPIKSSDGEVLGVVTVYSSTNGLFTNLFYRVGLPGLLMLIVVVGLLAVFRRINVRQQAIIYQRSVFITTTSHDIRSPLRGIMWALDLMKNPKADREVLISKMEIQMKYVIDLVESVLATVRTDFALNKFRRIKQDIIPLLVKAVDSQRLSAEQYGIKLQMDLPHHMFAKVDEGLMSEVISNLLSNAIKYTKQNTTVLVKAQVSDSSATFSVSDQGEGMTTEEQSRLFESFYRTESAKLSGRPGTGMGLALVKEIVSKHRGSISVESILGKGSIFTVKLPK